MTLVYLPSVLSHYNSFHMFIYKLKSAKLSFPNQKFQGGCWEPVLSMTSAFNNQTSQGNPTTEQLNYASLATKVLLLISFVCVSACLMHLSSLAGDICLPTFQEPVQIPPDFTTLHTLLLYFVFLISSLGLRNLRDQRRSLIHKFIHSTNTYGVSTLFQALL